MFVTIDEASAQPIYAQIAGAVRRQVAAGEIRPGERLAPARDLAEDLDVNMHTVLRAYQVLRDEGLIELRRGRGAVISAGASTTATHLAALAAFVTEARRAGMSADEAARLVKEAMS